MPTAILIVHILAAAAWFGANVVRALLTPRLSKEGGEVAASWHLGAVGLGRTIYMPAAVILVITGSWMVLDLDLSFGARFVSVGFAAVIIGAILGSAVLAPQGRLAASAHRAGDAAKVRLVERKLGGFNLLDTVVLVVAVVAMVQGWT